MTLSNLSIKPDFRNTVIAFNNSGVVLKDRSDDDLIDLAIMARRSGDQSLIVLFESLPPLNELQEMKLKAIEQRVLKSIKPWPRELD